jgi:hypothetical protein
MQVDHAVAAHLVREAVAAAAIAREVVAVVARLARAERAVATIRIAHALRAAAIARHEVAVVALLARLEASVAALRRRDERVRWPDHPCVGPLGDERVGPTGSVEIEHDARVVVAHRVGARAARERARDGRRREQCGLVSSHGVLSRPDQGRRTITEHGGTRTGPTGSALSAREASPRLIA